MVGHFEVHGKWYCCNKAAKVCNFKIMVKHKNFTACFYKNIAAMTSTTGPSPPKCGRPRHDIGFIQIKLKSDVHGMWNARKDSMGLSGKTHTDFARHLLINFCKSGADQSLAWQSSTSMESPGNGINYIKYILKIVRFENDTFSFCGAVICFLSLLI